MVGTTIPHEVKKEFAASSVLLKPASQGTGVIAGGSVRAVVESAGVRDILSKVHGSTNPVNVTRATLEALRSLHSAEELSARRGVPLRSRIAGQPAAGGLPIPDLSAIPQIELQTGVFRDDLQIGETFGQVLVQPEPVYARGGAPVHVAFRSGHPKNDLRRNNSYFRIERDAGGGNWVLAAWDALPETRLYWGRPTTCATDPCALSQMDVFWYVPPTATPGSYRIRLVGSWKNGQTGALTRYEGRSDPFTIQ
jgi:hypothetical protein